MFFTLNLFGIILFTGFVRLRGGVLFIHVSDDKAIAFRVVSLNGLFKQNVNVFESIEFFIFKLYVNAQLDETAVKICGVLSFIKSVFLPVYKANKPFTRLYQKTTLGKCDSLQIFFVTRFAFNILSIINILIRKLKNKWKTMKA